MGLWGDTYYPEPTLRERFDYLVDWIKFILTPKKPEQYWDVHECVHPPEGSCDHGWRGKFCLTCKYYDGKAIRTDGPTPARPLDEDRYISIISDKTPGYEPPYQTEYKRKPVKMSNISDAIMKDLMAINENLVKEYRMELELKQNKGASSSGQGTGLQNQMAQEPIEGSTPSAPVKRNINLRK